jgi:uncharacterized protein YciI
MLFTVTGFFKPGVDTAPGALQTDFNEHLGQPNLNIRLAGPLLDEHGAKIGFMGLVETETFEQAEAYLRDSPYFQADLYDRTEVAEFNVQVGRLA